MYFNISNALCRLSTESIMYVLLDVAPTPEIIKKQSNFILHIKIKSNLRCNTQAQMLLTGLIHHRYTSSTYA